MYHFESKAEVEVYVRELGIPATFFLAGFFMSNMPSQVIVQTSPDNAWTFVLPAAAHTQFPTFDTRDTGKWVKAIVRNRDALLGKRVLGADAYVTAQEIIDVFAGAFPEAGKTARFHQISEEQMRENMRAQNSTEYVIDEIYEMARFMEEFGYYGGEPLEESLKYVEDPLTTWEDYARNAEAYAGLK